MIEAQLIGPPGPQLLRDLLRELPEAHEIIQGAGDDHRLLEAMEPELEAPAGGQEELAPAWWANEPRSVLKAF